MVVVILYSMATYFVVKATKPQLNDKISLCNLHRPFLTQPPSTMTSSMVKFVS